MRESNPLTDPKKFQEQFGMRVPAVCKLVLMVLVAALVVAIPALAAEIKGQIKSIDRNLSQIVVHDEETKKDVVVSLATLTAKSSSLGKRLDVKELKPGSRVVVNTGVVASRIALDQSTLGEGAAHIDPNVVSDDLEKRLRLPSRAMAGGAGVIDDGMCVAARGIWQRHSKHRIRAASSSVSGEFSERPRDFPRNPLAIFCGVDLLHVRG